MASKKGKRLYGSMRIELAYLSCIRKWSWQICELFLSLFYCIVCLKNVHKNKNDNLYNK